MDFTIPDEVTRVLACLDDFIAQEIRPLEWENDDIRFICEACV